MASEVSPTANRSGFKFLGNSIFGSSQIHLHPLTACIFKFSGNWCRKPICSERDLFSSISNCVSKSYIAMSTGTRSLGATNLVQRPTNTPLVPKSKKSMKTIVRICLSTCSPMYLFRVHAGYCRWCLCSISLLNFDAVVVWTERALCATDCANLWEADVVELVYTRNLKFLA